MVYATNTKTRITNYKALNELHRGMRRKPSYTNMPFKTNSRRDQRIVLTVSCWSATKEVCSHVTCFQSNPMAVALILGQGRTQGGGGGGGGGFRRTPLFIQDMGGVNHAHGPLHIPSRAHVALCVHCTMKRQSCISSFFSKKAHVEPGK